jgi:hypothetical protein
MNYEAVKFTLLTFIACIVAMPNCSSGAGEGAPVSLPALMTFPEQGQYE